MDKLILIIIENYYNTINKQDTKVAVYYVFPKNNIINDIVNETFEYKKYVGNIEKNNQKKYFDKIRIIYE